MATTLTEKLNAAFGRFQQRDAAGAERLCNEVLRESPGQADALHLLGVLRLVAGDPTAAAGLLEQALAGSAQDASIHEHLGMARLAQGDGVAAEAAFSRAVAFGANHGQLHMRLGMALAAQGKFAGAVANLRTAAAQEPEDLDISLNLANALAQNQQFDEALTLYERLSQKQPANQVILFNLGNLYRMMERLEDAIRAYEQALAAAPNDPDTHNNLGIVYQIQGRLDEASDHYQQALVLDESHAQARTNLGNVRRAQGRLDEAVDCYEEVLRSHPDHADALINLAPVRGAQGQWEEAQRLCRRALEIDPGAAEAHRNLGFLFRLQGRFAEATASYRAALELAPWEHAIHHELGAVLRDGGDLEAAAAAYREAVAHSPRSAPVHYELAEILKTLGRYDEAIAAYERALALQPDYHRALGGLIFARQSICSWDGIAPLWQRLRDEALGRVDSGISPFSIAHMPFSPEDQLACAQEWSRATLGPLVQSRGEFGLDALPRGKGSRIRIGYLSWDFHQHATAYLTAELFELHDRSRFEIHTYSYGPDDNSAIRARIRTASEHFIDVSGESFVDTARRIRRDGIDVLVDLKGYTLASRPQILALRPSPVQVSWLGFPATMGTDCVDYIVADPFIVPQGAERYYAETVIRLPACYQANDRKRETAPAPTREQCGLPPAGIVFCSFNTAPKLLPDVFAIWMRLLRATPGSVLWLLENNRRATDNLRRAAAEQGIAPERLIFAARKPMAEHVARYRVADLALDTFPYTSHTTASDALWAGCPFVSCAGDTFASRVAGSLLINAGLPELVTENLGDYERLNLALAADPERLKTVRAKLRDNRDSCPLFDAPRFVAGLEAAYTTMLKGVR